VLWGAADDLVAFHDSTHFGEDLPLEQKVEGKVGLLASHLFYNVWFY